MIFSMTQKHLTLGKERRNTQLSCQTPIHWRQGLSSPFGAVILYVEKEVQDPILYLWRVYNLFTLGSHSFKIQNTHTRIPSKTFICMNSS